MQDHKSKSTFSQPSRLKFHLDSWIRQTTTGVSKKTQREKEKKKYESTNRRKKKVEQLITVILPFRFYYKLHSQVSVTNFHVELYAAGTEPGLFCESEERSRRRNECPLGFTVWWTCPGRGLSASRHSPTDRILFCVVLLRARRRVAISHRARDNNATFINSTKLIAGLAQKCLLKMQSPFPFYSQSSFLLFFFLFFSSIPRLAVR